MKRYVLSIPLILATLALLGAPVRAEENPAEFGFSLGPSVGVVVGDLEQLSDFAVGFRGVGSFRLHPKVEALLSFDWALAHKKSGLSSEDGLVFYGVDAGVRYVAKTSRGFSMFAEALVGRHFWRLATGSDVFTESGFGLRGGLGAIVPLSASLSLVPSASYATAFLEDAQGDSTTLDQFVIDVALRLSF